MVGTIYAHDLTSPESGVDTRRIAVIRIDARTLVQLFTAGKVWHFRVDCGVPDGARVVGSKYDPTWDAWELAVEHESLEPISFAVTPPVIDAVVTGL